MSDGPGGYQVGDPVGAVTGQSPDRIAEQIAIFGEDGDVIRSAPASPLPPQRAAATTTGAIRLVPPPGRKGLFKRRFGG